MYGLYGQEVELKNKAKTKAKSFLKTLIVIATGIFSAIVSFLNKDKEANTTPNTDNSTKPNNSNSAPQNPPPTTTDGDDSADDLDNDVPEAPSATINVTEEEVETEGELDPEFHNCITTESTEDDELDGKIASVYQKGYKFKETNKAIRVATVSVYKK